MSANNKYYVIEAATYEARKRHRILIEQELAKPYLMPEHRQELAWALKRAIIAENASRVAQEDACESMTESDGKDKSGDGSGDQKGGKGGSGSSSASGDGTAGTSDGSQSGDGSHSTSGEDAVDTTSLLFYLASQDVDIPAQLATASFGLSGDLAVAAATLIYKDEAEIALLHEPLGAYSPTEDHSLSDILPALEEHAAELGAQILQLKVFMGAVEAFRQKHGYSPLGKPVGRTNNAIQTMQKTLRPASLLRQNGPD